MPPFRTYLVLSILFFLVLYFDPKEDFGILFEPAAEVTEQSTEDQPTTGEIREAVLDELVAEGIIEPDTAKDLVPESADPAEEEGEQDEQDEHWDGVDFSVTTDGEEYGDDDSDCDQDSLNLDGVPDWMARRMTPERLQAVCEKVSADDGKALVEKLKDNIPAALFILLPLMALVLKMFYPLSKRYYVEHLLFVVHFHAFFFLLLILQILFSGLGVWMKLPEGLVEFALVITSGYIPVYLYKSMRRVYGQGHGVTVPKFIGLLIAYFIGLAALLAITAIFAAFSI